MEITASLNYLAIFVSALAANVLGALWYSPLLFGKKWMKLSGLSPEKMETEKKKGMAHRYILNFLASFVMAYVLSPFIAVGAMGNINSALLLAFWLWIGFIATKLLGSTLWEGKSWGLYFLNISYELIAISLMAVILALWR